MTNQRYTIRELIELANKRFPRHAKPEYIESVHLFFKEERISYEEAVIVLKEAVSKHAVFPAIRDLKGHLDVIRRNSKMSTQKQLFAPEYASKWVSKQAPGTPANFESCFVMIKNGDTEHRGFKYTLKLLKLSEDEAWQAYLEWTEGRIHPVVQKRIDEHAQRNQLFQNNKTLQRL
jgi:hypothetical protein